MAAPADFLRNILAHKATEVTERSKQISIRELSKLAEQATPPRGFAKTLYNRLTTGHSAVIAEIKRASPSKGLLREDFDPVALAIDYQRGGASALSILTDEKFFQGKLAFLTEARAACSLPVLRKDFIIDAYQVYEARASGADCILLIVAALGDATIHDLTGLAHHLDMDVLVEVHDEAELERVLPLTNVLLGINNRNLHTFATDLETTLRLLKLVPPGRLVITESGIHSSADVRYMRDNGVHAFLVGEAFMRAASPGDKLQELFG